MKCSIGICVYNEEKNIVKLLRSIQKQKTRHAIISEIIVIASATTDHTTDLVRKIAQKDKRIILLEQKTREGKASAVNLFIKKSTSNILLLSGGDLLLTPTVVEQLVSKFSNKEIGMTGAHPIPVNDKNESFSAFSGYVLWELHHQVSLQKPKMGEVIAFRKIFQRIPTTGADEASIEPLIRGQGYKIVYVPSAIVYNKTPTILKDFITQRRRNYWLHLVIKYEQSYLVSTLNIPIVLNAIYKLFVHHLSFEFFIKVPIIITIEIYARILGWLDYRVLKRKHTVWEFLETTKNLSSTKKLP